MIGSLGGGRCFTKLLFNPRQMVVDSILPKEVPGQFEEGLCYYGPFYNKTLFTANGKGFIPTEIY